MCRGIEGAGCSLSFDVKGQEHTNTPTLHARLTQCLGHGTYRVEAFISGICIWDLTVAGKLGLEVLAGFSFQMLGGVH